MANYIISYDLNGKTPTHAQMDAHMNASGWEHGRIMETVWYIGTQQSLKHVHKYVKSILSDNDLLIVVESREAIANNLLISNFAEAWNRNR